MPKRPRRGNSILRNRVKRPSWEPFRTAESDRVAGQHLCAEGEGEHSAQGSTRSDVPRQVVDPLGWRSRTLVLMDSLHGDGPTLARC